MTDIGTTAPPPPEGEGPAPVEGAPEAVTIDPELLGLFESLRPLLTEFVKVGITEAQASMVIPTVRTGTVQLMDHTTGSATVLVDGDTAAIPITVVCEYPIPGDRVRCTFWGAGAAFVDGILGGFGLPPAALIPYVGIIDGDTSSSTGKGPPRGTAWARGQVLKQNAAPGFYAKAGTTHNTGGEAADEVRLPDMRGRLVLGLDNMGGSDAGRLSVANTLGGTGGAATVTLVTANMPSHNHDLSSHNHSFSGSLTGASVSVSGSIGSDGSHSHNVPGTFAISFGGSTIGLNAPTGNPGTYTAGVTTDSQGSHAHSLSVSGSISGGSVSGATGSTAASSGSTGSGSAVTILPPYLLVHWLVKL